VSQSEQDRERHADDMYTDRRITGTVYCGSCGYDLRTLPYIYRCPECGQEYNARPLKMEGIFMPHMAEVPTREALLGTIFAVGGVVLILSGMNPPDIWRLLFGLILLLGSASELRLGLTKLRGFLLALRIRRRIERDEW
jgi:hypothetical protein